jgi:tetratricopeptide (TPR) repeat protein
MKAWLILIPLLFAVLACGDTGGRDAQGVAIGDESQVLARRHLESGLALHASGNFLDAIPEYDLALRIYPHYAEAYLNRGLAYARSDQSQRAIQDFEQALRLNPNLPKAYAGWAGH